SRAGESDTGESDGDDYRGAHVVGSGATRIQRRLSTSITGVRSHRILLRGGDIVFHISGRRRICRDGKYAALRVLRACPYRAGAFALFAQCSSPLATGASKRGDCNRANQWGGAQPRKLVRLEFYPGKLGGLMK